MEPRPDGENASMKQSNGQGTIEKNLDEMSREELISLISRLKTSLDESVAEKVRLQEMYGGKIKAKVAGQGKPKDTALKSFFKDNEVFAEAFNKAVFNGTVINPSKLIELDTDETAIITIGNQSLPLQYFRDVLKGLVDETGASLLGAKTAYLNGSTQYLLAILGEENQMHVDYKMPLRVYQTKFLNYSRQANIIEERNKLSGIHIEGADKSGEHLSSFLKTDRIVQVICLVVYYGDDEWDGPKSLEDMYVANGLPDLGERNPLHLLDVKHITKEVLEKYTGILKSFLGSIVFEKNREEMVQFMEANQELFSPIDKVAHDALIEVTGSEFLKKLGNEYATKTGGVDYMSGFDVMIQNERKDAVIQERNTVAERLINNGSDGQTISIATGYDRNQINTIAQRLNRTVNWGETRV